MKPGQRNGARKEEFLSLLESDPDECWPWLHADNGYGYGRIRWGEDSRIWLGSRLAYTLIVGEIAKDLTLDHLCHTNDPSCMEWTECAHRSCVNPAHLEPVTRGTNVRRASSHGPKANVITHCVNGHEFTPENTLISGVKQRRACRTCRKAATDRYRNKTFIQ